MPGEFLTSRGDRRGKDARVSRVFIAQVEGRGGGNRGESEATDAEKNRRVNVDVT